MKAPTPRTDKEWNRIEPKCAEASQLAESMYQFARTLELEIAELKKPKLCEWTWDFDNDGFKTSCKVFRMFDYEFKVTKYEKFCNCCGGLITLKQRK
jgi:hypothetical protein